MSHPLTGTKTIGCVSLASDIIVVASDIVAVAELCCMWEGHLWIHECHGVILFHSVPCCFQK